MAGIAVKYSLLAFPIASAGLGVWQIKRLEWKKDMIRQLDEQIMEEPIGLNDVKDVEKLKDIEYRRIRTRGRYDPDPKNQLFLKPRNMIANEEAILRGRTAHQSNNGVNVITPFIVDGTNLRILVNRGWLAVRGKDGYRENAHIGLKQDGSQELVGVLRKSDTKTTFGVNNDVTRKEWHIRDIEAMSQVLKTAPVFIDAEQDTKRTEGPIGGQTQMNIRNEHLNYAITWFSLSGLTFYMWYSKFGKGISKRFVRR